MARQAHTDIQVLIAPHELEQSLPAWAKQLQDAGIEQAEVHTEAISLACEPDNMLVTEYEAVHGSPPIAEVLHRIVVNAVTDVANSAMTKAVVACLPAGTAWYGTSADGHIDPGANAACNVRL